MSELMRGGTRTILMTGLIPSRNSMDDCEIPHLIWFSIRLIDILHTKPVSAHYILPF